MANKNAIRIGIIVLSVLLAISVLFLVGLAVYGRLHDRASGSSKAPGNEIHQQLSVSKTAMIGVPLRSASYFAAGDTSAASATATAVSTEAATDVSIPTDVEGKAYGIFLHKKSAEDNAAFRMPNMFPGDSVTQYYGVEITYRNQVTVRFTIDIDEGCEKMAEILRCKIVLLATGEEMYDGLMCDVPESLNHVISSDAVSTEELYYGITVYVDSSVGNEYQGASLTASFRWWVNEIENLEPVPPTGDEIVMTVMTVLAVLALPVLILLRRRRKKYEYE